MACRYVESDDRLNVSFDHLANPINYQSNISSSNKVEWDAAGGPRREATDR
jgi:hypothetical protein